MSKDRDLRQFYDAFKNKPEGYLDPTIKLEASRGRNRFNPWRKFADRHPNLSGVVLTVSLALGVIGTIQTTCSLIQSEVVYAATPQSLPQHPR